MLQICEERERERERKLVTILKPQDSRYIAATYGKQSIKNPIVKGIILRGGWVEERESVIKKVYMSLSVFIGQQLAIHLCTPVCNPGQISRPIPFLSSPLFEERTGRETPCTTDWFVVQK